MAALQHYSPEDVTILVAGFLQVEGLAEGSFVTISKDVMPFSSVRTTDGQIHRLYTGDQTYTVSLTLMSTSDSNDTLTKLWQLDELTKMGKLPFMIKDQLGTSLLFSPTAWIESIPDSEYSDEISTRTWVFKCTQAAINVGGNSEASSGLGDLLNIATSSLPGFF